MIVTDKYGNKFKRTDDYRVPEFGEWYEGVSGPLRALCTHARYDWILEPVEDTTDIRFDDGRSYRNCPTFELAEPAVEEDATWTHVCIMPDGRAVLQRTEKATKIGRDVPLQQCIRCGQKTTRDVCLICRLKHAVNTLAASRGLYCNRCGKMAGWVAADSGIDEPYYGICASCWEKEPAVKEERKPKHPTPNRFLILPAIDFSPAFERLRHVDADVVVRQLYAANYAIAHLRQVASAFRMHGLAVSTLKGDQPLVEPSRRVVEFLRALDNGDDFPEMPG